MFISVVVPVYGCEKCLRDLVKQVSEQLIQVGGEFEIILVEDRGPDGSWSVICELAEDHPQVVGLRLSRNFGQHVAITAGLAESKGDYVAVMDCDLQDPPEVLPKFIEKMKSSQVDIVFGERQQKDQSFLRIWVSNFYVWLLSILSGERKNSAYGTFSLLSRKVVNSYLELKDQNRHFLYILNWLGFEHTAVSYSAAKRQHGKSSYSFSKLVTHALQGIFFESTRLLIWMVGGGFLVAFLGFSLAAYFLLHYVQNSSVPPGWTSLMIVTLVLFGVSIICIGIVGIYIGQVFEQTKDRPLFVVDERRSGRA